jgi:hypothetical protein
MKSIGINNLIGHSFEHIEILREIKSNKYERRKFLVLCKKCKKKFIGNGHNIASGHVTQCLKCSHKATGASHIVDITGKVYRFEDATNVITVIKQMGINKHHQYQYECRCDHDDGTFKIFRCGGTGLTSGNTRSCGCRKKMYADIRHRKMIGRSINNLRIDSYAYTNKRRKSFYNCTCLICGSKCIKKLEYILAGSTTSCSMTCTRTHDWTGDKNEKREVLRWTGKCSKKWYGRIWECHCFLCNQTYHSTSKALSLGNSHICNMIKTNSARGRANNDWFQMQSQMYWSKDENRKKQSERGKLKWRNQFASS